MPLRIRFAAADLTRLTFATRPDPLWELLLSLHALQSGTPDPRVDRWRAGVTLDRATRSLLRLAPPRGYSPDFLTPAAASAGLAAGLDEVLRTPARRIATELALLTRRPAPPQWGARLAAGDRHELADLGRGLAEYHRRTLRPHWARIEKVVDDELTARTRVLAAQGTDVLLNSLHPALTWRDHVLEIGGDHVTGELELGGRGLRLVPAYFCRQAPTLLADPGLPPVLVYPAEARPEPTAAASEAPGDSAALANLLGATRATALRVLADGCTTTELGNRVGITTSAASYHASILRSSGLVTTERTGTAVVHQLTVLGADLLGGRDARV
ncbi:transcriptional regulator [Streptomyces sp. MN03-5084-2B]|nr:transcriptional regulator [Streptomyces sp. MN03-5084-2B]